MAKLGRRKTEEQMERILRDKEERGLTNAECAAEAGLSVETIKRWKKRARERPQARALVEWRSSGGCTNELEVELADGMKLRWGSGWKMAEVLELVRALRSS